MKIHTSISGGSKRRDVLWICVRFALFLDNMLGKTWYDFFNIKSQDVGILYR